MSAAWKLILPPLALISPAIFSPPAASRSRMPTTQPSSASRRAIAAPMPLAPPVSRTVLSFNPRIVPSALLRFTRQHPCDVVGDDHLAILVLDVDLRSDDASVALRGRPHRRHLDLGVNGVADPHRLQHLLVKLQHGQASALDHALAQQALDQAVGQRGRDEPTLDGALLGAERLV